VFSIATKVEGPASVPKGKVVRLFTHGVFGIALSVVRVA
jgi:hypothetical protein